MRLDHLLSKELTALVVVGWLQGVASVVGVRSTRGWLMGGTLACPSWVVRLSRGCPRGGCGPGWGSVHCWVLREHPARVVGWWWCCLGGWVHGFVTTARVCGVLVVGGLWVSWVLFENCTVDASIFVVSV